ncbi:dicarboxylate/amino acid:cation symporter [Barnesiella viscericola]|uniref:dicarboxylate/amino acid:cation symporter n=1 Tax=Barnesiella viscericola TaxID=397865 RepID=UPI0023535E2D|nr:dicarboxylate/amino acid:cation symporter [Barnesiella viscericola]
MKKFRISLLGQVLIAIAAGVLLGQFLPIPLARVFVTFNGLFGNFLNFAIPLIIIGLIIPAIADLGKGAGRLLLITALIAYGSTIFSGFFTYFTGEAIFPRLIAGSPQSAAAIDSSAATTLKPFFTVEMPAPFDIMTALLLSFCIGLGLSAIQGNTLRMAASDLRDIISLLIEKVIIPLLPLHIFGIFLNMTLSGQVASIISVFVKIIVVIFVLHILLLLIQFSLAGLVARKNPLRLLKNMLPAYATALGTQSSAATIPVTLAQTLKNGVSKNIATFVIPLCATIHLSGSTMKITACAMAIMMMAGMPIHTLDFSGFILMLGITMVAAPGVPGGAIMAALGILESMLGFDETAQALMIALYIAMDSFGTACNVTGDGAIAVVVDRINGKSGHLMQRP